MPQLNAAAFFSGFPDLIGRNRVTVIGYFMFQLSIAPHPGLASQAPGFPGHEIRSCHSITAYFSSAVTSTSLAIFSRTIFGIMIL